MSNILELKNITKEYPGVHALDDVSVSFEKGKIHGLVGENGAGKSTLIKVITGAIKPNAGDVFFEGNLLSPGNPRNRIDLGIAAIYQEFNLFDELSVAENIYYNRYIKKHGLIDYVTMAENAQKVINRLGVSIDPKGLVKELSVGYKQLVEIAKSISRTVKFMIMDEPSAPLTNNELEYLFKIVKQLKEDGVTILYISHRLEEIFDLCDTVTVFRDGKFIKSELVSETNQNELITLMVNRELDSTFPKANLKRGEKVIEVKHLCTRKLHDVSFDVYRGERFGLAGLVGAGRTEIARAIFGADERISGEILINGVPFDGKSPQDAIKRGIGLIPEDRKTEGALLRLSIKENIGFVKMESNKKLFGLIDAEEDEKFAQKQVDDLRIKTPSLEQAVKNLSGGNQQKVVLAKWLLQDSDILIFDEPTRGIDVGAKEEIYNIINKLAESGKVIIIISSEMNELIGMSDRIIVMHEGSLMGTLEKDAINQEKILSMASGLRES
jgi:ribose transport system ATP-binding protein